MNEPVMIRLTIHDDPRDPHGPRLALEGQDDTGKAVRPRSLRRLLRRIIKANQK